MYRLKHAGDTVSRAEHAGDLRSVEGGLNRTEDGGVDHSGGTAGLADDACTFEFFHMLK